MLSKPSQNSGSVMANTPANCRPDPNSRAPGPKCSIKVEPSKILEDSSVQIVSGETCHDSAAVRGSHGNVQFGGLVRPGLILFSEHSQIYILEKSLARLNLPMLLMRGMMTKFMLTNIFGEPNDYILGKFGKAESSNATHARDDDQIHAHKYFW